MDTCCASCVAHVSGAVRFHTSEIHHVLAWCAVEQHSAFAMLCCVMHLQRIVLCCELQLYVCARLLSYDQDFQEL